MTSIYWNLILNLKTLRYIILILTSFSSLYLFWVETIIMASISILGFNVNVFVLLRIGALIIAAGLGAYVYLKHRKNKQNGIENLEIYT
jgi:glycerol-3-phosphate acyltransferase PlsY